MRVVFVGQYDWANCAHRVARALNAHYYPDGSEQAARVIVMNEHPFDYEEDLVVTGKKDNPPIGWTNALHVAQAHLLSEPGEPTWVFTTGDGSSIGYLGLKNLASVNYGTMHVGSAYRNAHTSFDLVDQKLGVDGNTEATVRFISADSMHLIHEKDTNRDFPYMHALDIESAQDARQCARPRLVHSPSSRETKGTDAILAAVEGLRGRKIDFDFDLIEGLSYDDCMNRREGGDIFIGQFNPDIGGFGYSEVEAAAQGMVVLSSMHKIDWECWKGTKMEPPPFINAYPMDILFGALRSLLSDSEKLQEAKERTVKWVNENATLKAAGAIYADVLERHGRGRSK
jgi:hypothetical protein